MQSCGVCSAGMLSDVSLVDINSDSRNTTHEIISITVRLLKLLFPAYRADNRGLTGFSKLYFLFDSDL